MDKMIWTLRRYSPADKRVWDDFAARSRNASFMHRRDYMDYHALRFEDHSLMAFKGERLMVLLPADITPVADDPARFVLHSHRGLTFGGWLLPDRHLDGADLLEIFGALTDYCRRNSIIEVDYKPVPFIYPEYPSQEDIYALFRMGAVATQCNLSTALIPGNNPGFNTLMRRHLRKAQALSGQLRIAELVADDDIRDFHRLLADCLRERHAAVPVHSAEELLLLHSRFPENIRFFAVSTGDDPELQAGVCVYQHRGVAHCQYIASTPQARSRNLLTPLFHHLIAEVYAGFRYFDFGTSNEAGGLVLNPGLLRQKTSYGGSGVAYERFSIKISSCV